MERVKTWSGDVENKDECVFIRGKFYHKTKDCYFHEGIYYSPESRYYVIDHETGERKLNVNGQLEYGVVGMKNEELIFGYFSSNIATNGTIYISEERSRTMLKEIVLSHNPQNYHFEILEKTSKGFDMLVEAGIDKNTIFVKCMNVWPFLNHGYIYIKSNDAIVRMSDVHFLKYDPGAISTKQPYNFDLAYNSEAMMDKFQEAYEGAKRVITDKENQLAQLLGDHTFGIEYESWDGRVPTYFTASSGIIPLRDGSLRHDGVCGYEYASVIMRGARGLASIKAQCDHLRQFTTFNEKCSMHIHVGNIARTPENMVRLWNGFTSIQKDFFRMFPSCLAHTSTYKQKDYCNILPSLGKDVSAQSIVSFLSDGRDTFDRFGKKHPLDPNNQSKWNVPSRYVYCNFNNFYYTGRGTVELRISTPTFNHNKVAALLIIFNAVINDALSGVYHATVESLIANIKIEKAIQNWLSAYCKYRMDVLSAFSLSSQNNSVTYYECISNDEKTGNPNDLY